VPLEGEDVPGCSCRWRGKTYLDVVAVGVLGGLALSGTRGLEAGLPHRVVGARALGAPVGGGRVVAGAGLLADSPAARGAARVPAAPAAPAPVHCKAEGKGQCDVTAIPDPNLSQFKTGEEGYL